MNAFITGTGTDIGKTYVACGLLRHYRGVGQAAIGLKPIMSGFDPGEIVNCDAGLLLAAVGQIPTPDSITRMAPFRFRAPLSPEMAAMAEGRLLDYTALLRHCRAELVGEERRVLLEGVGGVMVPLDPLHTVLDWMDDLRLPVILVTGTYLGTLSHTLSALAALRGRRLSVACVVVNETPGSDVDPGLTTAAIALHGGTPAVLLPRSFAHQPAAFAGIATCLEQVRDATTRTSSSDSRRSRS